MRILIISGGQSGVDQAALDVAIKLKIPYSGWCPQGGLAQNYPNPPGLLVKYGNLRETPAVAVEQRTAWNVRDSHATLLIYPKVSGGTAFARTCAELVFQRPCHVVDGLADDPAKALQVASQWLTSVVQVFPGSVFGLNIGGPRATEWNGAYDIAFAFLEKLLMSFGSKD